MIVLLVSKYVHIKAIAEPPTIQMHIWLQFIMSFEYITHI